MATHKRRFDDRSSNHGHVHKKRRPENGCPLSSRGHSQDLPPLPPISGDYEKAVFTHASIVSQDFNNPKDVNYERLEFLGDAQLEHIASVVVFERYQNSTPGQMSSIRENLVKNEVLCKFSRMYKFDKRLGIALGTHQPRDWTKIHADVFEAYVAAVILSDVDPHYGFERATRWLTQLWEPTFKQHGLRLMAPKDTQSKEQLGRSILVKGAKILYKDEREPKENRAAGTATFYIGAYYTGLGWENKLLGVGEGSNKGMAGQDAAKNALDNPLVEQIKMKRIAFLAEKEKLEAEQASKEDVAGGTEKDTKAEADANR